MRRIVWLAGWCLLIICGVFETHAQRSNQYQIEAGGMAASDQTPFWLRANQYGTVPLKTPIARVGARLSADYRSADSTTYKPKADWGYAAEVLVNAGLTNQLILPEAYLKGRFGAFEAYIGRRREVVGLVDTLLSTGAYSWSGNALPIPKVQIGLPVYTAVPFTKGVVSFLGAFAHGWFENANRLVTGSFLHHKYVYGRIGKPSWRFRLYAGFNHQVIWGGRADPAVLGPVVAVNGRLPSTLRYFPAVMFGTRNPDPDDPNITSFEENRIGNHLGSLDLAADVDLNNWNLFMYRQFMYDDGSLFYATNIQDGLNGLRIRNRRQPEGELFFLRQLTVEYLFTGSQGGSLFVIDNPQLRGRDDYFNHSQFVDGWTYFGRTIGTPFLTPTQETRPSLPQRFPIANNRVSVYHVGASGLLLNKVELTTRLSYGRNAGTYGTPYVPIVSQFSGLLTASVPLTILGGVVLNSSFGFDAGGLLPNSVGGYVGIRKTGILKRRPAVPSPRNPFNRI
ncbi:capsule assembly Wzi family protein [Spirosoma montaniterrae]|uniref:Capsule assembly Wzi family protein n=1 Tax=Spirosoma montaniterrae TaxID=1178516 RepID=A0A1P9X107_9BACT|nr:capsule assembly Wzi family protein [Spirosoma montaniterrae]AQG81310.1 hypothetical protein AWR27_19485 [Spirosoma montaniterrae]